MRLLKREFGLFRRTAFLFVTCCCYFSLAVAQPSQVREAFSTLRTPVESGQVQSIDLIYFPIRVTSDYRMGPDRLEKEYLYKLTIRDLSLSVPGAKLRRPLNQTAVVLSSDPADVRWGLTFKLGDGSVRKIYLDGAGRRGQIDNERAIFRGRLYDWLRHLTAPLR